jgi:hypothetical protein
VNLLRIEHGVEAQDEAYEKLEKAVPGSKLSALQPTFCPMERDAMLGAALDIVSFFREQAPRVRESTDPEYPAELERLMSDRLDELSLAARLTRDP